MDYVAKETYNSYQESCKLATRIFLTDLDECKKFPKYFQIGTVNYCNARCSMCPQRDNGQYNTKRQQMTYNVFKKIADEIAHYSEWVESIGLYWLGEPLLDGELVNRVKLLKNIGVRNIQISTNGQLLDVNAVHRLLSAGVSDLRISIDAFSKEVYDRIRQGLNFENVTGNIRQAIKTRDHDYPNVPIRLRFVRQEKNDHEWIDFKSYWEGYLGSNSLDVVQFIPSHTKAEWSIGENKSIFSDVPCIALFSSMVIDSDGSVPLCCMDAARKVILGNVNESSISSIWRSQKLHQLRLAHLNMGRKGYSVCADCDSWAQSWI